MIIENDVLVSVSDVDVKNGVVDIPDGVTIIGRYAFYKCSELTSVTIPDSVTCIGNYAFKGCIGLTSITIPDSVTCIGDGAFYGCSGLTNISIPDSVTSIGECAFYDTNLKSKVANYKAFRLKGDKLFCLKKEYREGVKHRVKGEIELCTNGIHYCTNLFDIFNYYYGEIDKDIAIYEIEVGDKVLKGDNGSKCCTNSCVLKKRLYRGDIIRILNKGEASND